MKGRFAKIVGVVLATLLVSVMVFSSALEARSTIQQPFAIDGVTRTLAPGEVDWYAFPYAGDESQVQAWLPNGTGFGVTFAVFTQDQVLHLGGDGVEPVGQGTTNEFGPGVLSWSGSFFIPGFYFISVKNTGVDPASYVLRISGSSLRLP